VNCIAGLLREHALALWSAGCLRHHKAKQPPMM
jgi:hypothetical protein